MDEMFAEFINKSDNEFDEYVGNRCNNAVMNCNEYIEMERSGKYTDEELSIVREKLIFKAGWLSAMRLFFTYNKL